MKFSINWLILAISQAKNAICWHQVWKCEEFGTELIYVLLPLNLKGLQSCRLAKFECFQTFNNHNLVAPWDSGTYRTSRGRSNICFYAFYQVKIECFPLGIFKRCTTYFCSSGGYKAAGGQSCMLKKDFFFAPNFDLLWFWSPMSCKDA